ncbi:SDR family oxidoreductase [Chloroflexota bacterium]
MNRIVVTGGAGFIGSHLVRELIDKDNFIIILDDLSTGKLDNISDLIGRDNVKFVQRSITDLPLVQEILQGVEYVFHQAALARVPRSIKDPLSNSEVNIGGTLNILLAARDNKVKKVIYASSSSVYGHTPAVAQKEDMTPNPLSPYAVTKLTGEYFCNVFSQIYGLPTICLRYFNVYGPRQDPWSQFATAIPAFIGKVFCDQAPVIFGDGEQSRDSTFIEDVVRANILAARSNAEGIYNIGSGKSTTMNQLAQTILRLMKRENLGLIHEDPRAGDPKYTLADISKAKTIGYEPKWTLEEGLKETIRKLQIEL